MLDLRYPNIQFERRNWTSLNGKWDFYMPLRDEKVYSINVPFCPESELSGLSIRSEVRECVYEKAFQAPKIEKSERLFLHFGAVDYEAKVYVNGKYVGRHTGGYTPFAFDITQFVVSGENRIKVKVYDDRRENVPSGKQSEKLESYGCFYTNCTGIWQSVWLEVVPENHIKYVKYFPNIVNASVDMEIGTTDEGEIEITVLYEGRTVGYCKSQIACKRTVNIQLSETHLWEIGHGRLYDVVLKYGDDEVHSYFGLREVKFDGMKFLLNGKSVFQRFVLDQGYYKEGVYTPKSEDSFKRDIQLAMMLGFNGIRLHQKVFDPKYLYYCDKLGCMVWGEFPSWGIKYDNLEALGTLAKEWVETVERDFNHPSIVTWCPLNETWKNLEDSRKSRDVRFIDAIYSLTKSIDTTRPCVDVSGGFHGEKTDLYDFHCYEPFDSLKAYIERFEREDILDVPLLYNDDEKQLRYQKGVPVQLSEFGGIKLSDEKTEDPIVETINECAVLTTDDWGYGKAAKTEKEFVQRYEALATLALKCKKISGFCYTQLYDIEQEQNGFFTYERAPKLSQEAMEQIAACNRLTAQIEK